MRLTTNGTSLIGTAPHARTGERMDPRRAQAIMTAQGFRPTTAQAIAGGALVTRASTIDLGRMVKLLS